MERYMYEREGQIEFYNTILPRVNSQLRLEDIISDNTDGVLNGNLLEFKLHISDLNAALFQCIKYLSARRIKGKPVPANILIIDLNATTVWVFKSETYLEDIEKVYFGGASKDNSGFIGKPAIEVLHYEETKDGNRLVSLLKEKVFAKIHIDEIGGGRKDQNCT